VAAVEIVDTAVAEIGLEGQGGSAGKGVARERGLNGSVTSE